MAFSKATSDNQDFVPQPLCDIAPGTEVEIVQFEAGHNALKQLSDMGLCIGAIIEVQQHKGKGWGPIRIALGESRIALGHGLAEKIFVRPVEEPPVFYK